jgi:hydroxymethylglutaryl-CoA reductase
MAIVTNASRRAMVRASGQVPCSRLGRGGYSGAEVGGRIVRAAEIAASDHDRAVTHNKGVLNGIAALTQATGNDTRAVEAAAHGWAATGAGYAPLTSYRVADDILHCRLECPLPLGTVGGAVTAHPVSRLALRILGNPGSRRLAAIAAAVGLAQNLAALRALVSEGIQHGHMRLHAERLAFDAGARGVEVAAIAAALAEAGTMDAATARRLLSNRRASPPA